MDWQAPGRALQAVAQLSELRGFATGWIRIKGVPVSRDARFYPHSVVGRLRALRFSGDQIRNREPGVAAEHTTRH